MNRTATLVGGTLLVGLGALGFSSPSATTVRDTKTVKVHCRNGDNDAFVTPARIRISVGDRLAWTTDGTVVADSIEISLKHPDQQAWPFEGNPPEGGSTVSTRQATTPGTYQYNVTISCRVPGGGHVTETIDPDIIIE
jgi:plastocyanin